MVKLRHALLLLAGCCGSACGSSTWLPGQKAVMIWCGVSTNETEMADYGQYLKQNSDAITAIAPTIWHLAQDGVSLTADDATMAQAAKLKKQSGVRVIPTVFDNESYNQGTLKPRLLKLFANPHKFIASIVNASMVYGFDGVNLDFEPRWKASPEDAASLLKFVRARMPHQQVTDGNIHSHAHLHVNQLSDAMHAHGKVVSIDASPCVDAHWQGVKWQNNCMWWDMGAYNESRVDSFCNMFTYSNWTSLFTRELMDDLNHFTGENVDKIGLGLDSQYMPTLTDEELQVRFDLIDQLGIREIDIWVERVPDSWLPYLRKFLATED